MEEKNIKEALLQGSDNSQQLFRQYMKDQIHASLWKLMQEEVAEYCGLKYHPDSESDYRRSGSEEGAIYMGGKRRKIVRPRVRREDEEGREHEVKLRTYAVARADRRIEAEVADCMAQGMSTRSFERMGLQGASRATVSRRWVEHSVQRIEQLRSRNLGETTFFGLIIDGVFLSRELVVLICIGLLEIFFEKCGGVVWEV